MKNKCLNLILKDYILGLFVAKPQNLPLLNFTILIVKSYFDKEFKTKQTQSYLN